MPKTTAARKKKLDTALKAIEKKWGPVHVPKGHPLLDQAVYLILRDNWDYRKATKALATLQEEFVDWNEVRVTTAGELRGVLAPMGDRDVDVKIERIRTLLDNLYRERNRVSLEFLREKDAKGCTSYLESLRAFGDEQVGILVQLAGAEAE